MRLLASRDSIVASPAARNSNVEGRERSSSGQRACRTDTANTRARIPYIFRETLPRGAWLRDSVKLPVQLPRTGLNAPENLPR